jgi:hypothetical protein
MISFEHINELLSINNKNKYVFIPIIFKNKTQIAHKTILIINNNDLSIKLFDSNGISKFNNLNSEVIDKFIEKYFEIYNVIYDTHYSYIKQSDWNYININLNTNDLKSNDIDAGHCAIFTLLIAQLLTNTNNTLIDIIKYINTINKNHLFDIIMKYTQCSINNIELIIDKKII